MEFDTGLRGPVSSNKDEWDIEYKSINQQLKNKKVITEEIYQERINPLIPIEGIIEEDIEILQHLGSQKQKEYSVINKDPREEDDKTFVELRKKLAKPDPQPGICLIPKKRSLNSSLSKLKSSLKIKKVSD